MADALECPTCPCKRVYGSTSRLWRCPRCDWPERFRLERQARIAEARERHESETAELVRRQRVRANRRKLAAKAGRT